MQDLYSVITDRNSGIISPGEQNILKRSKIAVAGCGAGGGAAALSLARLGVRHFKLADPDVMDLSNINRQEGAYQSTRGKNKTQVISNLIKDVDPDAEVQCYERGISEENIEEFLKGSDIVLEEIDYHEPKYTHLVHKHARKMGIPVITGIPVAWNAFLFFFAPDGMTYEEYVGLNKETPETSYDINVAAYAPEPPLYLSEKVIQDILAQRINIPAVDPAIRMSAALVSSYCYFYLTKKKPIKSIPYYYSSGDLYLKEERIISEEDVKKFETMLKPLLS